MSHNTIVLLFVVLVIGLTLVFYKYNHRARLHDNTDQLAVVIKRIFNEAGKSPISQNRLIKGLKQHLGVNEKMALKLIGKARRENLINVEGTDVTLPE